MIRLAGIRGCLRPGSSVLAVLSETLDLEVLRDGEEGIELLLGNVNLALVHELEHGDQVVIEDALEVQKRRLVRVPPQD